MPDGSDGKPVPLSALSKRKGLQYAKDLASKYLEACEPVPVAQLPAHLSHLSRAQISELKKSEIELERERAAEYADWQLAYSSSIVENGNRLRGALWCYRELAQHADAAELRERVRRVLGEQWGVYAIPEDRCECDQLARETAVSMARAETRRWEDRQ